MCVFCDLGASGSGASGAARKKNLKSHVWNYFSRHPTDDPTRINVHCEICIQLGKNPEPFSMQKQKALSRRPVSSVHCTTAACQRPR